MVLELLSARFFGKGGGGQPCTAGCRQPGKYVELRSADKERCEGEDLGVSIADFSLLTFRRFTFVIVAPRDYKDARRDRWPLRDVRHWGEHVGPDQDSV